MIKAIIFDCFGVVYTDNFDKVWVELGGDLERDTELIRTTFYATHTGKLERSASIFAAHLGVTEEEFRNANEKGRGVDHEVLSYVKELRQTYKLAMLSNIGPGGLKQFIKEGLLEENFDLVVESAAIGYAKPEAAAYEYVADKLGVRLDECIMIDDREYYCEGARAVGMQAILYTSLDQLKQELKIILTS
jgi:HAD superfamily hydrolase (TIGR01509 family)